MKVFVVNLARRPDRRARMERILPRSWAVEYTTHWPGPRDGAAIRPAHLRGFALFDWQIDSHNAWWNRPLKLGEIGCAVSHWLCWQRAAAVHAERTLILEDDVTLVGGIEHALEMRLAELNALDPEWDLVYVGRWVLEPDSDARLSPSIVRPAYSYCTFAYMLSATGLAKLLDVGFERALIPVDELLPALYMPHPRADVRRRYPPRLNAYAFDPPLVTQLPKEVAGSDTEATGDYSGDLHPAALRLVGGTTDA
ncbi:glycosyltransferase family 25 protein [Solirubrobacter ginsenosidimutans]|uniref:Glycosyltransferase family 25 protein n=1 Tax=Solirubrobacter ginsenosidimutans TaxID=490573 RepID=A0A9X3S2D1_9ACTN|nr:glycosyltransferase family 25 protein [Solirubrobacter ginsenosidimutans]MDA0164460.1 glycosyltransferase family 25 protein [Solirubrobacter ginsenosidimutans]